MRDVATLNNVERVGVPRTVINAIRFRNEEI